MTVDFEQCREKEYQKIKNRLEETGQGRDEEVQWDYFGVMDQIMLGHKPTTVPEHVVHSGVKEVNDIVSITDDERVFR